MKIEPAAGISELIENDKKSFQRIIRKTLKRVTDDTLKYGIETVQSRYNISGQAKQLRANTGNIESLKTSIEVRGTRIPIVKLNAVQTPTGIQFQVKRGKASQLAHAFGATMQSGHKGVFLRTGLFKQARRGRYKGNIRETISEKYTISVPEMFGSTEVLEKIESFASERFAEVLQEELEKL